jgi:hypothetical protein
VSGEGTIYSYSIMHYPGNPGFDELPYAVVIVELSEQSGLRTVGNLLDVAPHEIEIGMPVVVDYEVLTPEISLPQWRANKLSGVDVHGTSGSSPGTRRLGRAATKL